MLLKILILYCILLLVQLGDGQIYPTTRPSNGVQLYLPYQNIGIIPDFSMIYAGQFYDVDVDVKDGINDALWCQSANNGSNIGLWYYPNGNQVPLFTGDFDDSSAPSPIFSKRFTGQIALARNGGLPGYEGLYTCIIPDENGVNQTLVVGAYRTGTYNKNDGPDADSSMQFSLISTSDANPPVFTLTFNVSDGPPTNVTCTDGSNPFTIASSDLSRVVVNGPGFVTQVTVTVRMRQAGTYQCTVSNARVDAGTIGSVTATSSSSTSQPITVAGTPTDLTATRLNTGLTHIQLSWSSVSGVAGYEVFYQLSNGISSVMSAGTTTNTMLNITSGLTLYSTYNFFVVSYGSEDSTVLPSDHSNISSVTFSKPLVTLTLTSTSTTITMMWTLPLFTPHSYEGFRQCRRLCNQTLGPIIHTNSSISSPYTFTGIDPGTYCIVGLNGIYDNNTIVLGAENATTLSYAPTSSVSNIIISSVEARSMTVSWDEVPCSGQNGLITGYLLYYTNTTFSDTVNITGGDNRQYTLTALRPYTNYTVTVRAYNDDGTGPASSDVIQQTEEAEPGVVSDLRLSGIGIDLISVTWNIPTVPNGVIIMYEIRYRESNSNGPYNMTNTTNTQYSIGGLLPNTNYTIGVRAYTSVGPGEWSDITASTSLVVQDFVVTPLNTTAVWLMWQTPQISGILNYTVYYNKSSNTGIMNFSSNAINGVIGGLVPNSTDYQFTISVTIEVSVGVYQEGPQTQLTTPGQPPVVVTTMTSNLRVVGETFKITFIIETVKGLVLNPIYSVKKMDELHNNDIRDLDITNITQEHDSFTNVTIVFEILMFQDRGKYMCIVDYTSAATNGSVSFISQPEIVSVEFPPLEPNITKNYYGLVYAGTPLTQNCSLQLDDLVDINTIVSFKWRKNGMIFQEDSRVTISFITISSMEYVSSLSFNPLNITDNGQYHCYVSVVPTVTDNYILNASANITRNITVNNLPNPIVNITTSGIQSVGGTYTITCTVNVVDRLIVNPIIEWRKNSLLNSNNNDDTLSVTPTFIGSNAQSLIFSSLNTSDAGQYTCQATTTIPNIASTTANSSENLQLQIPTPDVSISLSRQTDLLAGSTLNITCTTTVNSRVNTPVTIATTWIMGSKSLQSGPRLTIHNATKTGSNQYQSMLSFNTLSRTVDSGNYICNITVNSDSNYIYVAGSNSVTTTTSLNVTDPTIGDFAAMPDSFLGLETSCPASDPYDSFTLVCTASKPVLVIPALEVIWLHNGTVRQGVVTTNNGIMTNTLSVTTSKTSDSGSYTCQAILVIPDSNNITTSETSTVTIKRSQVPYSAQDISVLSLMNTSATISFTIPSIAYTLETYTIQYIGLELQNILNNSMSEQSPNITATNMKYQITLTGLEEANTYNFTVVSTNCIGNTSSETMNFTTLPGLPTGTPLNCNVTVHNDSVTLQWDEPEKALQNGRLIGYNLTCRKQDSSETLMGLPNTRMSTETMVVISNLSPYTVYNCNLSAINVVGEGPPLQCSFATVEDRPSDAPQNFTSIPTKTDVTFNWRRPSTPNGIIIQYNLTVINLVTNQINNTIIDVSPNQETFSMTINGFSPYQNYTATVTASTSVGYGPSAITKGRTDPDISSAVNLFTIPIQITNILVITSIPIVNDSTVNLTWTPPTSPNGYISNYNIAVYNRRDQPNSTAFVLSTPDTNVYTNLITQLAPGIPYYITIGAVNEVGQGENVTITVFSQPSSPTQSPSDIEASRSQDDLSITVTWAASTFDDVGAFFIYKITAAPGSSNGRRRQSANPVVQYEPYNETSTVLTGLDPREGYSVTVTYVILGQNGEETGPDSSPIQVPPNIFIPLPSSSSSPSTTSTSMSPPPPTLGSPGGINIGIIGGAAGGIVVIIVIIIIIIIAVIGGITYKRRKTGEVDLEYTYAEVVKGKVKDSMELGILPPSPINGVPTAEPEYMTMGSEITNTVFHNKLAEDLEEDKTQLIGEDEVDVKMTDDEDDEEEVQEMMEEPVYANLGIDHRKPIPKGQFHAHVQGLHSDGEKGFEEEFKSVPMATESSRETGNSASNKHKNRFLNIFPYDNTRVRLSPKGDSDYINACFVDGYNKENCYVAAQGPLRKTVGDFWRMIWEYKLTHIVMLTGVIEGGKKKCEQYWPENVGENLSTKEGLTVNLTSVVPFADYTIRTFKVTKEGDSDLASLEISHYHFTSWPDHGVPQFATSLIAFIKRVQKDHDKDKGVPLLVHCSAGVGRTGTFVMLDSMMDRLKLEDSINIYEFLIQMRRKRMYMVQTLPQYVFIHDALDEIITCGDTSITSTNLRIAINELRKAIPDKDITGFEAQLQLLNEVCYKPDESMFTDAQQPFNLAKNRYPAIMPLNGFRPRLKTDGETPDYINASIVDGHKKRNAYIVTQGPLKNTVQDFWQMIWEFKCHSIVQLCNSVEDGIEKCYMYWPTKEEEPMLYGKFYVRLQSEISNEDFLIRKIIIFPSNKTEHEGHVVTQFHYTTWPEHGHPTSTGSIIELIDMLTRAQMNSGNKAIAIVCNDGVGRSGAFICIHSQLERLKTEGEMDIFKYLKMARTRRIGLLSQIDHYVYCHEVLLTYIDSFDLYANFKTV